jgi:hypothetical protein
MCHSVILHCTRVPPGNGPRARWCSNYFPPCAPRIGDSDDLAKISLKFSLKAIGANC